MKYMVDVVPILQQNCYRCHGASTNSGSSGIVLEGHGNLKPYAESGTLIGVITHAEGFAPMPGDGGKLSDCNINKIRSWIANGMQNN
jgi:mono/diheme cytochrome c family protein